VAVHGVARDLFVVELQQEGHGLERAPRERKLAHATHVARVEKAEADEVRERLLEIARLLAHELELVGRRVLGDDAPGTVEDDPAVRRQRLDPGAIAEGQFEIVVVLHDLQPERACDEQ
jgi:hypothetical protein